MLRLLYWFNAAVSLVVVMIRPAFLVSLIGEGLTCQRLHGNRSGAEYVATVTAFRPGTTANSHVCEQTLRIVCDAIHDVSLKLCVTIDSLVDAAAHTAYVKKSSLTFCRDIVFIIDAFFILDVFFPSSKSCSYP